MAIPKGNYAAYQQTTPTKFNFGEVAEDVAVREQAQKDRVAAQEKERLERQEKIASSYKSDASTLTDVITGTDSVDQAFIRGVSSASDKLLEIYKQIEKNPSLANDPETIMKIGNLNNYSKSLSTSSQGITDFNIKLAEGVQDGSLSGWNKKYLNVAESIYGKANLEIGVDEKGRAIGSTIQLDDDGEPVLDQNGQPILEDLQLPQKMMGQSFPELVPNYNMAADAQSIGKELGTRVKGGVVGSFGTTKSQTWEDIKEDARELVKSHLGSAKQPSVKAKSIWYDVMGNEPKDLEENDMAMIEETYLNSIKPFYDSVVENSIDFSARNAANKEANRKKEEEAKEKVVKAISDFTLITDQDGNLKVEEYIGVKGDIRGEAVQFALPTDSKTKQSNVTVMGPQGTRMEVTKVILLDSGELAYEGFEYQGKATGQSLDPDAVDLFDKGTGKLSNDVKRKKVGGGMDKNDDVLTSVAKAYGLRNEGELKALLKNKKDNYKKGGASKSGKPTAQELIDKYKKG